MNFKPRGNRVLVEPEKPKDGIIIRLDKAEHTWGKVLSVGAKCNSLKMGDRIVFQKDKGTDMDIGLCMKETDVIGVSNESN